jgi:23S rRNA pseudouridine2605 synthase
MRQRLSKILAQAGVASRRKCEEMIFEKQVRVNGEIALLPQTMVDPHTDHITINGKTIGFSEVKVYFLLNKPQGYICTNRKQKGVKRAIDLFQKIPYRLFTVGRLDKMTQGLLIVTNDGQLAHRIMHPSFSVEKEYVVEVEEKIEKQHIEIMKRGVVIDEKLVKPLSIHKDSAHQCSIILCDGKKHEVRKLIQKAGLQLQLLTRVRIGPIQLKDLPIGSYREMTEKEKNAFFDCFSKKNAL